MAFIRIARPVTKINTDGERFTVIKEKIMTVNFETVLNVISLTLSVIILVGSALRLIKSLRAESCCAD